MDALDVLEPASRPVSYRGEQLDVGPLTIGAIPKIVRAARPVIDGVLALEAMPGDATGDAIAGLLMQLVEEHGERVYEVVALAVDRPIDWIAKGQLEEFLDLGIAVYEVNRDFFVRRLVPLLGDLRAVVSARSGSGPMPSTPSSDPATP